MLCYRFKRINGIKHGEKNTNKDKQIIPDQMLINKKKIFHLVNFAVPADHSVKIK